MICISIAPLLSSQVYHPIHYKRTNLLGQVCYGERSVKKRLHHDFVPSSFYLGCPLLAVFPLAFWLRTGARTKPEGSFALSRGRESRVTVSGVYGNLTGVWFSKRAEDFAPRANIRSLYVGVRHTRGGGVMTMMTILKHNILWDDVGVVQKL